MSRSSQQVIGTIGICLSLIPFGLAIRFLGMGGAGPVFGGFFMTAVLLFATSLVFLVQAGRPYTGRLVAGFITFWTIALMFGTWPDFRLKGAGLDLRQVVLGGGLALLTGWYACTGRMPRFLTRVSESDYEQADYAVPQSQSDDQNSEWR